MTRAEKASEPSMDEILASIRRIIAEEPAGARPLPSPPRAPMPLGMPAMEPPRQDARPPATERPVKPVAPLSPATGASPASVSLAPLPVEPRDVPASVEQRVDPVAAAMSGAAVARDGAMPRPVDPPLPAAGVERAPLARNLDSPFGRIAEALGSERQAAPRAADVVSAPARIEPTLPVGQPLESDLSDLLDDPPLPPLPAAAPAAAPAPVELAREDSPSLGDDRMAPRFETSGGRVFARRSIDLGQVADAISDRPTLMPSAPAAPPPSLAASLSRLTPSASVDEVTPAAAAAPKLTAQSRVVDKILSARTASAKVAPPPPEPLPAEPQVIAAMPEVAPVAAASLEPRIIEEGLDDLIENEDAQSALGMLAAGLAASAPANGIAVSTERAEPSADDVPTVISMPALEARPVPVTAASPTAPRPAPVESEAVSAAATPERVEAAAAATAAPAPKSETPRPAVSTAAPSLAALAGMIAPPAVTMPAPTVASPAPSMPAVLPVQASAPVERAVVGVRTVEDMVAELLRPMLREWLAENMPRMVEKALRIELADGLKTVNHVPRKSNDK